MKSTLKAMVATFLLWSTLPLAQDNQIVSIERTCQQRAYEFLVHGSGIEESQGINALKHLGKVLKEKRKQYQHGEIRELQFNGMSVSIYLASTSELAKFFLTGVSIFDSIRPTKYGIRVGSPKKQVEKILCSASQLGLISAPSKWTYADGLAEVVILFDRQDNIASIEWHYDLD